jgi:acetyl-CoA C-acetyltransferase
MKAEVYLSGGLRTPIGSYCGVFSKVSAIALGSSIVKAVVQGTGIKSECIDEIIMGNVLGAGLGPNVARSVGLGAGLNPEVGATTIGKVCGSGLKSVMAAAQAIQCEDAEVVVAGGVENMTGAPYLLEKARTGYRMGNGEIIDAMLRDGLWDPFSDQHMGMLGEECARKYAFSRQDQDTFAIESYERARKALADGSFKDEVSPVEITSRKGTQVISEDEEPGRYNPEKFLALRPAFGKEGSITAGNASSISDGAAALLVTSAKQTETLGLKPQARIAGYTTASINPKWFTIAPVQAIQKLLDQLSWKASDVDLFEINEAFAVVPMAVIKDLDLPREKVNIHGGAIAIGHPIGASGSRILVTLMHALEKRKARRGIASLCIGGGEAVAMAVERLT